jgi:hypothetical protein
LRRAPPLQGGGRRFEPCSAHSLTSIDASGRLSDGARQGNTANRLQTSERAPNRRASPQMIDDVAASIGRLRHMLDGTVRFATNYDSGPPAWQGTPGSVVAGELAEAPTISLAWETAVRTVLSGLRLQLFTVSRHLKSISNLLATEMPPFGPAILARSALETAARAWWLVDSQIEMRRRVARGLTDRLYSADYAAALAREYGVGDSYFSEPPSRVEGICSDLSLRITGRERNRYVGTEARQTSTKLCADLLRSIDPDPERSAN